MLRGAQRHFGLELDGAQRFLLGDSLGFALAAVAAALLLAGLIRLRRGHTGNAAVIFIAIPPFLGLLAAQAGVRGAVQRLEDFDRADRGAPQRALDILVGHGLDFEIFTSWSSFEKAWRQGGTRGHHNTVPFSAVIWAGLPVDAGDGPESWSMSFVGRYPLLHVGLGAHLPAIYHSSVFSTRTPRLDWEAGSARSAADRACAYGRTVAWTAGAPDATLSAHAFDAGRVLYAVPAANVSELADLLLSSLSELSCAFTTAHLEDLAVLRLDDPGTAQSAYLESWTHAPLSLENWEEIERILTTFEARLSIGYVPGWLDDGDETRGDLEFLGKKITARHPGEIFSSAGVRYFHRELGQWYDLAAQADYFMQRATRLDFEVHGYTHISPDVEKYLRAADRHENPNWYREFLDTSERSAQPRTAAQQAAILRAAINLHQQVFTAPLNALIPPGHAISPDTLELARRAGFRMVADSCVAVERGGRMLRTRLIPGTDITSEAPAALPSVLIFHDRDIALHGTAWLSQQLARWHNRGVGRFTTLRELALRLRLIPKNELDGARHELRLSFSMTAAEHGEFLEHLGGRLDFWLYLPAGNDINLLPPEIVLLQREPARGRVLLAWQPAPEHLDRPLILGLKKATVR